MNILKALLAVLVLAGFVFAEDEDPMLRCDMANESCVQKCDESENVSPDCYEKCDTVYYQCLDRANGYVPDKSEVEPKEAVQAQ